jgi:hypothetical protein
VLQVKSDAQTKGQRQFRSRPAGSPQGNPQLQTKQINPSNQRLPNTMQQKSNTTTPTDNNRSRQFDGNRQNSDRKSFDQKKLEQKGTDQRTIQPRGSQQNLQRQNNQPQFQKKSGSANTPSGRTQQNDGSRSMQQHNAPRQNIQPQRQNNQPSNVQRQQHNSAPRVQQQTRPQSQPSRSAPKSQDKNKNN